MITRTHRDRTLRRNYRGLEPAFIRAQAGKDAIIALGMLILTTGMASGTCLALRHGSLPLAIACAAVGLLFLWITGHTAWDALETSHIADDEEGRRGKVRG